MSIILAYFAAVLFYALVGWYFWRTRWRSSVSTDESQGGTWVRYVLLVPLALHGMILYQSVFVGDGLNFGVGNAISLIVWLTVFIYWFSVFFYRLNGLKTLIAPLAVVAIVAVLLPLALPSQQVLPNTELPAFKAHMLVAMLAYSLLTIGVLHALLIMVVENRLHHPVMSTVSTNLPPLLVMEKLLFRIILVGFVLLSLTLFSGVIFSTEVFGQPLTFTHKTLFGFISWGIFAALLVGRQRYGWRGRVAVRWILTGFVVLVLAYIGSKFVAEVLLKRF